MEERNNGKNEIKGQEGEGWKEGEGNEVNEGRALQVRRRDEGVLPAIADSYREVIRMVTIFLINNSLFGSFAPLIFLFSTRIQGVIRSYTHPS